MNFNCFIFLFLVLITSTISNAQNAPATPITTPNVNIDDSIKKAIEEYNLGNYEKSLEVIRGVIVNDLQNPKLRYLAAHNHWKLKNYSSADSHLKVFIQVETTQETGYIELALLNLEQNKFQEAMNALQRGLLKVPASTLSAKYYNVLARVALAQGSYTRALSYIETSKTKVSDKEIANKFEALLLETRANLLLKHYENAEIPILWALNLKNNNPYALNLAATLYLNWAESTTTPVEKTDRLNNSKKYLLEANQFVDKSSSLYLIIQNNLKLVP